MYLKRSLLYNSLISLLFLLSFTKGYSKVILDLKRDFKAVGNGIYDDTKAFENAAIFINSLKSQICTLYIPQGTYRVGRQSEATQGVPFPKKYSHVFYLKNAKNVTILGIKAKTKITYNDNLYYGSFDLNGVPISENNIKRPFNEKKYAHHLGSLIRLENCTNIKLKYLDLDGNMYHGKMKIGGGYGDLGTQLEHYGIYVLNSNSVSVQECSTKRFGLDGIYLWNNLPVQNANNILIEKCVSSYNGRQALSICSGTNILIRNSDFSYTGKGIISSSPGAGIDIEPEDIFGKSYLSNTKIENCFIHNNTGPGMLFPPLRASEKTFVQNCTIIGNTNYAIWTQQKSVTYNSCKIYGTAVHNYPAQIENIVDATKYINCSFSDTLNQSRKPSTNSIYIYNGYLVSAGTSDNVTYENCSFSTHKSKVFWLSVSNSASQYHFSNCTISTACSSNDAIWIPNANIENSTFTFPANTLHLGLNYKSGKSRIDAKSRLSPKKFD